MPNKQCGVETPKSSTQKSTHSQKEHREKKNQDTDISQVWQQKSTNPTSGPIPCYFVLLEKKNLQIFPSGLLMYITLFNQGDMKAKLPVLGSLLIFRILQL